MRPTAHSVHAIINLKGNTGRTMAELMSFFRRSSNSPKASYLEWSDHLTDTYSTRLFPIRKSFNWD